MPLFNIAVKDNDEQENKTVTEKYYFVHTIRVKCLQNYVGRIHQLIQSDGCLITCNINVVHHLTDPEVMEVSVN